MTTRTGNFPVGFYVKQLHWAQDLLSVARWATDNGFEFIDLDETADKTAKLIIDAGFKVGSADLIGGKELSAASQNVRNDNLKIVTRYIQTVTKAGVSIFNLCAIPLDPSLPRLENLSYFMDSLRSLTPIFEDTGSCLAIEGWPGPGALATTPESYRFVLDNCASRTVGINYDPSHLIATGIDPIRFAKEFAPKIYHVHGKDTEISTESQYQVGIRQPPLEKLRPFSGSHWRYTIPGHGEMSWTVSFKILLAAGYQGGISIELEDENFNGTETGEKEGLLVGKALLSSA